MTSDSTLILAVLTTYLLGAIPFGLLISRWMTGKDPRQHGSGNIGATNAMRTGGKTVGLLTLLADILKGTLPVAIAVQQAQADEVVALIAIAAFLGHIFPVYLRFKGGKGVATMYGVLIPWLLVPGLISFAVWFISFKLSRYVSLASILGGVSLPIAAWAMGASQPALILCCTLGLLMVARHHSNIIRLIQGTEAKIEKKQ